MIDLNQKQKIISAHLGGVSNREITRQMHMSKDTVNKYVREYDEKRAEFLSMDQTWNSRRSPPIPKTISPGIFMLSARRDAYGMLWISERRIIYDRI